MGGGDADRPAPTEAPARAATGPLGKMTKGICRRTRTPAGPESSPRRGDGA